MGEGSVQSGRVHWLVKAFVDQVSDIKKKTYIHHEVKARHGHIDISIDQSNFNWI